MKIMGKKGFEISLIGWIIIGLVTLVIILLGYLALSGKMIAIVEFIKSKFILRGRL